MLYKVVYHPIPTSNHNYETEILTVSIVVYHPIPTSNHNFYEGTFETEELYIILFLHQTTTQDYDWGLAVALYIILFLHQTTTDRFEHLQLLRLYIILFLHQTTTHINSSTFSICCISSYSYIKPQHYHGLYFFSDRCISSYSYIKTQQLEFSTFFVCSCISSYSYIKPQPAPLHCLTLNVVYHPIPTSNHNPVLKSPEVDRVVYHPIPTSNHNYLDGH